MPMIKKPSGLSFSPIGRLPVQFLGLNEKPLKHGFVEMHEQGEELVIIYLNRKGITKKLSQFNCDKDTTIIIKDNKGNTIHARTLHAEPLTGESHVYQETH